MILVTGGTGFIGGHLVSRLVAQGKPVRVAARGARRPELPGGVEVVRADAVTGEGLPQALAGIDGVVHLVAVIIEKGAQTFDAAIRGAAERTLAAAREAGVRKFVYISAIGADPDPRFPYWAAKYAAEKAVTESGLNYTILRPCLVFGPGDGFFTRLAGLVRWNPVVPIAGDGKTRFQPIAVDDLVTCIIDCLEEGRHDRQLIEVGGPEHLTYEEMVEMVRRELGLRRLKAHVPLPLVRMVASLLEGLLSDPPVTRSQLAMLAKDNITDLDAVPRHFGFTPRPLAQGLAHIRK